jgi:DNA primase
MRERIIGFLSSLLGDGQHTTKDNYIYHCPVCNHRKKKLEIDVIKGFWHCWVCNRGGKNFYSLLRWIKAADSRFDELRGILGVSKRRQHLEESKEQHECELPQHYAPLWVINNKDFYWRAAINYLRSRNIYAADILKYRLGYCSQGPYAGMIIVPSYDRFGRLNYFTARAFMPNARDKFKNPPMSKDIVGFELMINWDEPIILVESAFDAMAIRRNAIPLFGKTISTTLKQRIIEKNVRTVNICLDADAITEAINHVQYFMAQGINVLITKLENDDDPSSIGFSVIWDKLEMATPYTNELLFEQQVFDNIYGKGKIRIPHRRRSRKTISASQRVSGSFSQNLPRNP